MWGVKMNLLTLVNLIEKHNALAELIGQKKMYILFDGFYRLYTKEDTIRLITENCLNSVTLLNNEIIQRPSINCKRLFTVSDDGFDYEIIIFNE